jgi:hypothetical protein
MANITLNCLIVPKGDLMNISFIKVMQAITISSRNHVSDLETAIQDRLGAPFNNTPLKICKIHPGSVTEMQMQPQSLISAFFPEEPLADRFNVLVYSLSQL